MRRVGLDPATMKKETMTRRLLDSVSRAWEHDSHAVELGHGDDVLGRKQNGDGERGSGRTGG
jgi:hypothetical protein